MFFKAYFGHMFIRGIEILRKTSEIVGVSGNLKSTESEVRCLQNVNIKVPQSAKAYIQKSSLISASYWFNPLETKSQ